MTRLRPERRAPPGELAANPGGAARRWELMIFLWRFLGARRLLVVFVVRKLWQVLRNRPPGR